MNFSVTHSLILQTSIANICDIAINAPGSMDPEERGSSCFQRIHSAVGETTPKLIVIACNESNEPTQTRALHGRKKSEPGFKLDQKGRTEVGDGEQEPGSEYHVGTRK